MSSLESEALDRSLGGDAAGPFRTDAPTVRHNHGGGFYETPMLEPRYHPEEIGRLKEAIEMCKTLSTDWR